MKKVGEFLVEGIIWVTEGREFAGAQMEYRCIRKCVVTKVAVLL